MTNEDLKNRTKQFALRIIRLGKSLKGDDIDKILVRQLIRSATSVAANYRAAIKAKSKKDFIYKLNVIEEEADESYFWLELIAETEIIKADKLSLLINEARELTAIFTAQGKTAKESLRNQSSK
jgi:four helix bundle protein